jgi:PAS domain S-box-containing protein
MKKHNLLVPLMSIFLAAFIGMSLFEILKQSLQNDITILESHLYTIIFTAVLATVAGYFIICKRKEIHNQTVEENTKRKQAEEMLRRSEARYRGIIETMQEGFTEIDSAGRIVFANKRSAEIFGYTPEEFMGIHMVGDLLFPMDSEEMLKRLDRRRRGEGMTYEQRFRRKNGEAMWTIVSATPFQNEFGAIMGSFAMTTDITERKRMETALKESEAKYCDLYDHAPDMYYSLDSSGIIRGCNETFLRRTGYSKEELLGRPIVDLCDPDSIDDAKKTFQQFQAIGEVHDVERRVKCKDGRIIIVSLNASAVRDEDGNIVYSRSVWHDITQRKEQEAMIHALAITDQLTGLYNRRGFTTLAEQQLRIEERTRSGMVLLFADVDDLKQINDKLGHKSGDEFAVLAPEASLEYSDMIKNRLQNQLDIHNARAGRDYNLSLSTGMVYYDPSTPCSLDELISRADTLMYEQKRCKKPLESQEGSNT